MYDKDNIFAKIARGEIPAKKVYENEYALSFYDINPAAAKHVLIIPKGRFSNIYEFVVHATAEEQGGFWQAFRETADILGVQNDFNVLANAGCGTFADQTVYHFHLHLFSGERLKGYEEWSQKK